MDQIVLTKLGLQSILDARVIDDRIYSGPYAEVAYWVAVDDPSEQISEDDDFPIGTVYWRDPSTVNVSFPAKSNLYGDITYQPVLDIDGVSRRSNFSIKCYNHDRTTSISFNKIAFYAVRRGEPGQVNDQPFFFGQILLEDYVSLEPKSSDFYNQIEFNLQLDYNVDESLFSNKIFLSSKDYWYRCINNRIENGIGQFGLQYDGYIYTTTYLDTDTTSPTYEMKDAKWLIGTEIIADDGDTPLPQLGLQYIGSPTEDLQSDLHHRRRALFNIESCGDLELDLLGGCNEEGFYSYIPKKDSLFWLGRSIRDGEDDDNFWSLESFDKTFSDARRWDRLYLRFGLEVFNGNANNISTGNYGDNYYISVSEYSTTELTGYVNFANTSLRLGNHYNRSDFGGFIEDQIYYLYGNISNDIYYEQTTETLLESDLNIRSIRDLYFYTIDTSWIHINEFGTSGNSNGTTNNAMLEQIDNMITYGADQTNTANIPYITDKTAGPNGRSIYNQLIPRSKATSVINGITTRSQLRTALVGTPARADEIDTESNGTNRSTYILSSEKIWTNGDIKPMIAGIWDLGSDGYQYRNGHFNYIEGQKINSWDNGNSTFVKIYAHLYPSESGENYGLNPVQNTQVAYNIGRQFTYDLERLYIPIIENGNGLVEVVFKGAYIIVTALQTGIEYDFPYGGGLLIEFDQGNKTYKASTLNIGPPEGTEDQYSSNQVIVFVGNEDTLISGDNNLVEDVVYTTRMSNLKWYRNFGNTQGVDDNISDFKELYPRWHQVNSYNVGSSLSPVTFGFFKDLYVDRIAVDTEFQIYNSLEINRVDGLTTNEYSYEIPAQQDLVWSMYTNAQYSRPELDTVGDWLVRDSAGTGVSQSTNIRIGHSEDNRVENGYFNFMFAKKLYYIETLTLINNQNISVRRSGIITYNLFQKSDNDSLNSWSGNVDGSGTGGDTYLWSKTSYSDYSTNINIKNVTFQYNNLLKTLIVSFKLPSSGGDDPGADNVIVKSRATTGRNSMLKVFYMDVDNVIAELSRYVTNDSSNPYSITYDPTVSTATFDSITGGITMRGQVSWFSTWSLPVVGWVERGSGKHDFNGQSYTDSTRKKVYFDVNKSKWRDVGGTSRPIVCKSGNDYWIKSDRTYTIRVENFEIDVL